MKNRAFNSEDADLLLNYYSSSAPAPIQIDESATVEITVGDAKDAVYCNYISFIVPIGGDPNSLFVDDPKPTASVEGGDWIPHGANLKPESDSAGNYINFAFQKRSLTPFSPKETIVFKLSGKINRFAGTPEITVYETSGTESDGRADRTGKLFLTKNKAEFYLKNFLARTSSEALSPTTEFAKDQKILLSWESNGTNFRIYEKNNPKPIYSDSQTFFTVEGGINRATTFFLEAIKTDNADRQPSPTNDDALLAAEAPQALYDALTIAVANPDLTPNSIEVANRTKTGTLDVIGDATLAGALAVSGNTKLTSATAGSLGVAGHAELNTAAISGALNVAGKTTFAAAAFNGALSVNGTANIWTGNGMAARDGYMPPGSLTIGSIEKSYGGGRDFNSNTAALMFETSGDTEIAVHHSGVRLMSLMHYEGSSNRLTIGRDMNWGTFGALAVTSSVGIKTNAPRAALEVGESSTNTVKAILGCLPEGNDLGTYLAVKSYDTQIGSVKSFALEHHFYGRLNSAINFYRGGNVTGGTISFGTNDGSERVFIDAAGWIGIGTSSPTVPLEVVNFENRDLGGGFWYAWQNEQRNAMGGSHVNSISIKAAQGIQSNLGFYVTSDARIKKDLRKSDSKNDLQILEKLRVTDYKYVDERRGDQFKKGFIAQQVASVFPQAVSRQTGVVPDIYRLATIKDGWVELKNELTTGERVKLISPDGTQSVYQIAEATKEKFRAEPPIESAEVFVYGREVNDFCVLDYDSLAVLNISATQQMKKENDAETAALQRRNAELETAVRALAARVRALESRIKIAAANEAHALK